MNGAQLANQYELGAAQASAAGTVGATNAWTGAITDGVAGPDGRTEFHADGRQLAGLCLRGQLRRSPLPTYIPPMTMPTAPAVPAYGSYPGSN